MIYKLARINYNTIYIGRTNINFNARFQEHRRDFRYVAGKSKFSEYVLKEMK
jgi:GIY-YIG catalytic domain.